MSGNGIHNISEGANRPGGQDAIKPPGGEPLLQSFSDRLVGMRSRVGFTAKRISETEIRELYEQNQALLEYALRGETSAGMPPDEFPQLIRIESPPPSAYEPEAREIVEITGKLFSHLAGLSGNSEIVRSVRNINDRLHQTRLSECEILETPTEHVLELCELYYQDNCEKLARMLQSYHAKRIYCLPDLMIAIGR